MELEVRYCKGAIEGEIGTNINGSIYSRTKREPINNGRLFAYFITIYLP